MGENSPDLVTLILYHFSRLYKAMNKPVFSLGKCDSRCLVNFFVTHGKYSELKFDVMKNTTHDTRVTRFDEFSFTLGDFFHLWALHYKNYICK
jgi:hypothetical protein